MLRWATRYLAGMGSRWNDSEFSDVLAQAARAGHEVDIEYSGANDNGVIRRRTIIPFSRATRIRSSAGYVVSLSIPPEGSLEAPSYKHFKLDRIVSIPETRPARIQQLPPGYDERDANYMYEPFDSPLIPNSSSQTVMTAPDTPVSAPTPRPSSIGPGVVTPIDYETVRKYPDQAVDPIISKTHLWRDSIKCNQPGCGGSTEYGKGKCTTCGAQVRVTPGTSLTKKVQVVKPYEPRTFNSGGSIATPSIDAAGFYSDRLNPPVGFDSDGPSISPEEYEEIRQLDIDPETHDKATVKRLRKMGATHDDLRDVCSRSIPLEDYEAALQKRGNHVAAVDEALSYLDNYKKAIHVNRTFVRDNPGALPENNIDVMRPGDVDRYSKWLFQHHRSLRDADTFSSLYPDYEGRKRSHEWIMSECAKINPELREHIGVELNRPQGILPAGNMGDPAIPDPDQVGGYQDIVSTFVNHHRRLLLNSTNVQDYVHHTRCLRALANVAHSQYAPMTYEPDVYEE